MDVTAINVLRLGLKLPIISLLLSSLLLSRMSLLNVTLISLCAFCAVITVCLLLSLLFVYYCHHCSFATVITVAARNVIDFMLVTRLFLLGKFLFVLVMMI